MLWKYPFQAWVNQINRSLLPVSEAAMATSSAVTSPHSADVSASAARVSAPSVHGAPAPAVSGVERSGRPGVRGPKEQGERGSHRVSIRTPSTQTAIDDRMSPKDHPPTEKAVTPQKQQTDDPYGVSRSVIIPSDSVSESTFCISRLIYIFEKNTFGGIFRLHHFQISIDLVSKSIFESGFPPKS